MFSYSAFIENTPEMREWLEKIGYKRNSNIMKNYPQEYEDADRWITTNTVEYFTVRQNYQGVNSINCIGNPQLFKAVTTITTTTDIGKYYINNHTGQWRKCDLDMATDYDIDWDDWTEASIAELQEHFKIR